VAFAIHGLVFRHPLVQPFEDVPHERIAVLRPAIVHPLAVAARIDQAGPLQPGQMSLHLRLNQAKCVAQFADTRFSAGEQIQ